MTSGEDLIQKSYRSIFIAWVTVMIWCLTLGKPWIALSVTIGTLLSTAMLMSLDLVVRRTFVPGARKPRRGLLWLAVGKYLLVGVLLYWLVRWERISLPAFVGGIALVHFALLTKAIGVKLFGGKEVR